MSKKLSPEAAMNFVLRKRMIQLRSKDAAKEVRRELISSINENREHTLTQDTISVSKHAAPYGPHPSHTTLLVCFGL